MSSVRLMLLAIALVPCPLLAATNGPPEPVLSEAMGSGSPGCAVALFRDGQADEIMLAGMADLEERKPIDRDTLFYAASVSKQFTALAVAQLAAAGKLSLDDDVRDFIPELPEYEAPITLSMLVHHTSGVRDFLSLMQMAGLGSASGNTRDTALELLFRQQSTNFPPGTRYLYSNGGYLLLAEVVARASGEPFPRYVKRHVLEPLGMHRSHVLEGTDSTAGNLAHGYVHEDGRFLRRDTYPRFGGSGGLMTSINDLARYHADLASGHQVWTPAIRALLLTPGTLVDGGIVVHPKQGLAYAGGLLVGERSGHQVIQHGGSAEAFRTFFARLPDDGIGVAVLCNRDDRDAQALGEQAIARHVEGFGGVDEALGVEPGRYRADELAASYDLRLEGDRLLVRIQSDRAGASPVTMVFDQDEDEAGRYVGERFSISPASDGERLLLGSSRASGVLAYPVDAP